MSTCAGSCLGTDSHRRQVSGALLATVVPGDSCALSCPFVLIAIALYFALKPNMDDIDRAGACRHSCSG